MKRIKKVFVSMGAFFSKFLTKTYASSIVPQPMYGVKESMFQESYLHTTVKVLRIIFLAILAIIGIFAIKTYKKNNNKISKENLVKVIILCALVIVAYLTISALLSNY